jgi:hypothetical protein
MIDGEERERENEGFKVETPENLKGINLVTGPQ